MILLAIFSKEDIEINTPKHASNILRKIPEMTNRVISEGWGVSWRGEKIAYTADFV